eukprot:scaffold539903_cov20-Prasinocladus_malaysianus.AAC.1
MLSVMKDRTSYEQGTCRTQCSMWKGERCSPEDIVTYTYILFVTCMSFDEDPVWSPVSRAKSRRIIFDCCLLRPYSANRLLEAAQVLRHPWLKSMQPQVPGVVYQKPGVQDDAQ